MYLPYQALKPGYEPGTTYPGTLWPFKSGWNLLNLEEDLTSEKSVTIKLKD